MNKEFNELVKEVISSINESPDYLSTQVKVMDCLQLLTEADFQEIDFINSLILLLSISTVTRAKDCEELFKQCVELSKDKLMKMIAQSENHPTDKRVNYTERDFAKAVGKLELRESSVHKTGSIVHFIENHYVDATGRGFLEIVKPSYDDLQNILQCDLTKKLEGEG